MTKGSLLFLFALAPCIVVSSLASGCSGSSGSPSLSVEAASATDSGGPGAVEDAPATEDTTTVSANDSEVADAVAPVAVAESSVSDSAANSAPSGWTLTWSDEFNGPDGSAVDPTKWRHDTGGNGSGNGELEYYTDGTQNTVIQGGNLVITATNQGASQYRCSYGACRYSSGRINTEGLFSQAYGRFEARAQMPTGKGLWPAIWLLGDNINTVGWPTCGEIDFMETVGTDISTNHGTLHMPRGYGPSGQTKLPTGASFADAFHTFAVEWEPGTIRFYVDGQLYETQNRSTVPGGDTWEFEHPFFLVINVAVGGSWPGSPDQTTMFPQTLKVDWVRVYQKSGTDP